MRVCRLTFSSSKWEGTWVRNWRLYRATSQSVHFPWTCKWLQTPKRVQGVWAGEEGNRRPGERQQGTSQSEQPALPWRLKHRWNGTEKGLLPLDPASYQKIPFCDSRQSLFHLLGAWCTDFYNKEMNTQNSSYDKQISILGTVNSCFNTY